MTLSCMDYPRDHVKSNKDDVGECQMRLTTIHIFTNILELPIYPTCMLLVCGKKLEYLEKTCIKKGQEMNLQPFCCEAKSLSTSSP